jgi:type III secretory pathway component EscR
MTDTIIYLLAISNLLSVLSLVEKIATGYNWLSMFLIIVVLVVGVQREKI